MARIFISYSRKRRRETVALAAGLTEMDYSPWFDINLTPGKDFEEELEAQIAKADAVVTIWTPEARASDWVRHESHLALQQDKLICVTASDFEPGQIPHPFQKRHACAVTQLDDLKRGLEGKGVHPSGLPPAARQSEEERQGRAAIAWNAVKDTGDEAQLRAFKTAHRDLPVFVALADERLVALQAVERAEARAAWEALGKSPSIPALIAFLQAHGGLAEFRDRATALIAEMNASAEQEARVREILANLDDHEIFLRLDPGMHTASIRRISVTADGALMASASHDKTVKLWSQPGMELVRTLRPPIGEGNEGRIDAVALDPAGRWVAAGYWHADGGDNRVAIFDPSSGAMTHQIGPLPGGIIDLEVSPDGTCLAAGLVDSGIRLWQVGSWQAIGENTDYGDSVYGLAFTGAGHLATTSYDGHIRLHDRSGHLIKKAKAPGGSRPFGIAAAPDGARLAVGYDDSLRVDLLDAASLEHMDSADTSGLDGGDLSKVAWTGGAAPRLVAGGRAGGARTERLFSWPDSGRGAPAAWLGPGSTVMDLAPLPSGGLALGSAEPSLSLYSAIGTRTRHRPPEIADLRVKLGEHFTVLSDGVRLRFGVEAFSRTPVLFDLAALTMTDAPAPLPGLSAPDTDGLEIDGWKNARAPRFTRKTGLLRERETVKLDLQANETARSLAIAPNSQSFLLGADFSLYRFDAAGGRIWHRAAPSVCWGVNLAREGRLALAAYGDGTIRWHRAVDGAELLALFIHLPDGPEDTAPEDRDWILWTPEGYYTALSERAEDLIGWHVNRGPDEAADFYPAETFAETFRRPDKVAAALEGV